MAVPPFAEVHLIRSAETMRGLIHRDDLPDDPRWWLAVISVGQSRMLGAESGFPDAEEWASVLVEALDVSARRPALGLAETIHRRIMACVAAMHYFGERAGNPVRDPELVFRHLAAALGGTTEAYLARYRKTLTRTLAEFERIRAGDGDKRAFASGMGWMSSTRHALDQMCRDIVPRLTESPMRAGAAAWCAVLPQISDIRQAAKEAGQ